MQVYCTLFDSNYLSRGLACYESLKAQTSDFILYVFAFDNLSFEILTSLNLENLKVISLKEFEDEELLKIKSFRTQQEYCWTCTPSIVRYILDNFGHEYCTYIDADMIFYRNPGSILNDMKDNSVLITPHYYTPKYDHSSTSGIYCVQFTTFKNDVFGRKVLNWWREACLEWCFNKVENGKFGDQKYLDDWPKRFERVYVTQNLGEGVGPWNIQQWKKDSFNKIIFFHFHGLKIFKTFGFKGEYSFPYWTNKFLYLGYIKTIKNIESDISKKFPVYSPTGPSLTLKFRLKMLIEKFKFKNNIISW